ncbi:Na+/H+ antiporter subunit E [Nitrincola sp. A-D6]|uniref:Na+/H+ antiporter subunit E n=1 Tax=Nitrincola sp. A-D6 TaxID=1545442 RepID=UPI00068EEDEC|nr:Na+/H+ antiporter subunit E [Nitrincola sp. A-D6]
MAKVILNIRNNPMALFWRLILAGGFWWALTEGDPSSWMIGLPAVVLGVSVSFCLSTPGNHRFWLPALPRFLLYFLTTSLIAGIDIARRTLSPRLPLVSIMLPFETSLEGLPRWLLMSSLSLMPGTLSVRSGSDGLLIHSLDAADITHKSLRQLESHIARLLPARESE